MLSHGHGVGGHEGVAVICCSNNHSIDFISHLLIHLTPVPVLFCIGIMIKTSFSVFPIHIAKSDDVLVRNIFKVTKTHSANSDACNIQFVAGSNVAKPTDNPAG